MNNFLSNIVFFSGLAISSVAFSFLISFITKDWTWFARSGSIATMAGIILSVRPIFRMSINEHITEKKTWDGGTILGNTIKEIEEDKQLKSDVTSLYIGSIATIFGTLIWGYGDLLQYF